MKDFTQTPAQAADAWTQLREQRSCDRHSAPVHVAIPMREGLAAVAVPTPAATNGSALPGPSENSTA